jgi:glycosyltransferase involved in cell wall biosynthesis
VTNENIVCFAKDWDEDPTSNNHVMRLLAEHNRVLWLNSIAMRTPSLTSTRDLRKIGRKLLGFFYGPREVAKNLWVYTPIVVPLPHSRIASALNRLLLRVMIGLLRRKLDMRTFQLWTFLPNAIEYVGTLGEDLLVYYCIDEWSQFTYLDGAKMATMEEALCRRADVVFATARSLEERLRPLNPRTYLALHGVDHAFFAAALDNATPVAMELRALPQPVIGFFGLIHEWIDLRLIAELARRHPEWSIALVGKTVADTSPLDGLSNVHLLGRKPYAELPSFCKGFAVGLIPFAVNDLTVHVNPIKLREYLSAGLPVVSTALPEVVPYEGVCAVATDYASFVAAVEQAVQSDTPSKRRERSNSVKTETWEQKVRELGQHVTSAKRSRSFEQCADGAVAPSWSADR